MNIKQNGTNLNNKYLKVIEVLKILQPLNANFNMHIECSYADYQKIKMALADTIKLQHTYINDIGFLKVN